MKSWTPKEILSLRKKLKLLRPAFGRLIGVTGNYVYMLEKGVRKPSKTLRLLLDCIEMKLQGKEKGKEVKKYGKDKRYL